MVLWEITLATAYWLGLRKTYRLALRLQRRFIGPQHPRLRDFFHRRTRNVFDVALSVHKGIQSRDLAAGKNLGNFILRALDRMRPSAHISGSRENACKGKLPPPCGPMTELKGSLAREKPSSTSHHKSASEQNFGSAHKLFVSSPINGDQVGQAPRSRISSYISTVKPTTWISKAGSGLRTTVGIVSPSYPPPHAFSSRSKASFPSLSACAQLKISTFSGQGVFRKDIAWLMSEKVSGRRGDFD